MIEFTKAIILGAAVGLGAALILIFGITVIFAGAEALGFDVLGHTHESQIVCGTGLTCSRTGDGRVLIESQGTPG